MPRRDKRKDKRPQDPAERFSPCWAGRGAILTGVVAVFLVGILCLRPIFIKTPPPPGAADLYDELEPNPPVQYTTGGEDPVKREEPDHSWNHWRGEGQSEPAHGVQRFTADSSGTPTSESQHMLMDSEEFKVARKRIENNKISPEDLATMASIASGEIPNHMQESHNLDVMGVQLRLANMYVGGLHGVKQDISKAVKFYTMAAKAGNMQAEYNLGVFYQQGRGGLSKDHRLAGRWFRKAAKQGYLQAQYVMGLLHLTGQSPGVRKSVKQAVLWLERAADRGHKQAKDNLASLKVSFSGTTGKIIPLSQAAENDEEAGMDEDESVPMFFREREEKEKEKNSSKNRAKSGRKELPMANPSPREPAAIIKPHRSGPDDQIMHGKKLSEKSSNVLED